MYDIVPDGTLVTYTGSVEEWRGEQFKVTGHADATDRLDNYPDGAAYDLTMVVNWKRWLSNVRRTSFEVID